MVPKAKIRPERSYDIEQSSFLFGKLGCRIIRFAKILQFILVGLHVVHLAGCMRARGFQLESARSLYSQSGPRDGKPSLVT